MPLGEAGVILYEWNVVAPTQPRAYGAFDWSGDRVDLSLREKQVLRDFRAPLGIARLNTHYHAFYAARNRQQRFVFQAHNLERAAPHITYETFINEPITKFVSINDATGKMYSLHLVGNQFGGQEFVLKERDWPPTHTAPTDGDVIASAFNTQAPIIAARDTYDNDVVAAPDNAARIFSNDNVVYLWLFHGEVDGATFTRGTTAGAVFTAGIRTQQDHLFSDVLTHVGSIDVDPERAGSQNFAAAGAQYYWVSGQSIRYGDGRVESSSEIVETAFANGTVRIEVTDEHIWAYNGGDEIKRYDRNGTNLRRLNDTSSGIPDGISVLNVRSYAPVGFDFAGDPPAILPPSMVDLMVLPNQPIEDNDDDDVGTTVTPTIPSRPLWQAPPNNSAHDPRRALLLDFTSGSNRVEAISIARRVDGASVWEYYNGADPSTGFANLDPVSNTRRWWSILERRIDVPSGQGSKYALPAGSWGDDGTTYEFRIKYAATNDGPWSPPSTVRHITATLPALEAPIWTSPWNQHRSATQPDISRDPRSRLYLDFSTERNVVSNALAIVRQRVGSTSIAHWNGSYWQAGNINNLLFVPYQPGQVTAYLLPAEWGEDGETYEFRVAYRGSRDGRVSGLSSVLTIEASIPTLGAPTIVAPREYDPATGEPVFDPTDPITFTVNIPAGVTANRIKLRQRHPTRSRFVEGPHRYWSGDRAESRGWSGDEEAWALPEGAYTGDVLISLDPRWQEADTGRLYAATYTTATNTKYGWSHERWVVARVAPVVIPVAPSILLPPDGSEHDGTRPVTFTISVPAGEVAAFLMLRRRDPAASDGVYQYWQGWGPEPGWVDGDADSGQVAGPIGFYTGSFPVTVYVENGQWQDEGSTYEYSALYVRRYDNVRSNPSPEISITATNNIPSLPPTWVRPELSTIHDPGAQLRITGDVPDGEAAHGGWLRRRIPGSLTFEYRNAANNDWVTDEPDTPINVGRGVTSFDIYLPGGWQDAGVKRIYSMAFLDAFGVQSRWSAERAIFTSSPVLDEGVVLWRRKDTGAIAAINYDGQPVSLGGRADTVIAANYDEHGFPAIIYAGEAFYLTSFGHVIAYSLSTNNGRTAITAPADAIVVRALTANDLNTKAFVLETYDAGGGDSGLRLVCYDLPNFTTRTVVQSGQTDGAVAEAFVDTTLPNSTPHRRWLAVTDDYAYFDRWAVAISAGTSHDIFANRSNSDAVNLTTDNGTPRRSYAATNDGRVYTGNNSVEVLRRTGIGDAVNSSLYRIHDDLFDAGVVAQRVAVDASRWHIWAEEWVTDTSTAEQTTEGFSLKRLNLDGSDEREFDLGAEIEGIQVYRPHDWSYAVTAAPAQPTWGLPADGANISPAVTLMLELTRDTPATDRFVLQRRRTGTTTWEGWGIGGDGLATWLPNAEPLLGYTDFGGGYATDNVLIVIYPHAWGTEGHSYDFRFKYRHTDTQIVSAWSALLRINCVTTPGEVGQPTITAPTSGEDFDASTSLEFTVTTPGTATLTDFAINLTRNTPGFVNYEVVNDAGDWQDGRIGLLVVTGLSNTETATFTLPANWQPDDTVYEYRASVVYVSGDARRQSPESEPVTIATGAASITTGPSTRYAEREELEVLTPHAPTWSQMLHRAANRMQSLTLTWQPNWRYTGQTQTAIRILRTRPEDGGARRYRNAANTGWTSTVTEIPTTATSITLAAGWQGANFERDFYVAVKDEGGRWSPYSAAQRITTVLDARPVAEILTPTPNQQVGQRPVITWRAPDQIAYQVQAINAIDSSVRYDSGWLTGDAIPREGDDGYDADDEDPPARHRLEMENDVCLVHNRALDLRVRVKDALGRDSNWSTVPTSVVCNVRTAPAWRATPTTGGSFVIGLVTADSGISETVIERRVNPTHRAAAIAAGVPPAEADRVDVVWQGDHAPVGTAANAASDYTVRSEVHYEYRLRLTWDDETRLTTDWED